MKSTDQVNKKVAARSIHSQFRTAGALASNKGWLAVRLILVFLRLYLGGWMLLNGLNHFVTIFPQPMGGGRSGQLMVTLIETGLFGVVKSIEALVGVLLLADLFVPVALVLAMPVSVVVWYNTALLGRGPFSFSMAIGCLTYNVLLLVAYLPYFLPMMRMRSQMGPWSSIKQLHQVFAAPDTPLAFESRYRVSILAAGLVLTAALFYELHPLTPQAADAGKTPATIVGDYLRVAYDEGHRVQADALYLSPEAQQRERGPATPVDELPRLREVIEMIAQGQRVVVRQRMRTDASSPWSDIVDFYLVKNSLITEHNRIRASDTGD